MSTLYDAPSLSTLSSTLLSHGFLTSPLTAPSPLTPAFSTFLSQLTKCLWSLLSARLDDLSMLESLSSEVRVLKYENERMGKELDKEKEERARAVREWEREKAEGRAREKELAEERERGRRAREEGTKAKNALAFVKTQAAHETRRHSLLLSSHLSRLLKLQTASSPTRLVILNPSLPNPNQPITSSPKTDLSALTSEFHLLDTSLAESHAARLELERENQDWRRLLRVVAAFVEDVNSLPGFETPENAQLVELVLTPFVLPPPAEVEKALVGALEGVERDLVGTLEGFEGELENVRREGEMEVEKERERVLKSEEEREVREEELEKEREKVEGLERVVDGFVRNEVFLKGEGASEVDEGDAEQVKEAARIANEREARETAEEEKRRETTRVQQAVIAKERAEKLAKMESIRSKQVQDFLAELGESPAPVLTTLTSTSAPPKPLTSTSVAPMLVAKPKPISNPVPSATATAAAPPASSSLAPRSSRHALQEIMSFSIIGSPDVPSQSSQGRVLPPSSSLQSQSTTATTENFVKPALPQRKKVVISEREAGEGEGELKENENGNGNGAAQGEKKTFGSGTVRLLEKAREKARKRAEEAGLGLGMR